MNKEYKAGNYTGLANDYSKYRPGYSTSILKAILGLLNKPSSEVDFCDIGAGTGIWTRMVYEEGVKSVTAVEPNDDMRSYATVDSKGKAIKWVKGSAERTGLESNCSDLVSMASSFHWADFDSATHEFHRILRPGGRFLALWNPRLLEVSPMLMEIESHLKSLKKDIKRVSSGRSGITEVLTEKLSASSYFEDVVYLEGRHVVKMSPEHYIGVWRSVNDLRVQLGTLKFDEFLTFVENRIANSGVIEATYLTRAWSACRV